MSDSFRQWDERVVGDREEAGEKVEGREGERGGGSEVGSVMGGVMDMLHGMSREFVDALFDRPTRKPSITTRQSDKDSSGEFDDEL